MESEKKNLKHLKLYLRIRRVTEIPHGMLGPNAFRLLKLTISFNVDKYYYTSCASCSNLYLV